MQTTVSRALPFPAATEPPDGPGALYALAQRLDVLWRSNHWVNYTPFSNWATATNAFRFRYENGDVLVRGRSTIAAGFSIPPVMQFTVPSNLLDLGGDMIGSCLATDVSAGTAFPGVAIAAGDANKVNLFFQSASGGSVSSETSSSSVPFTWAVGDFFTIDLRYTPSGEPAA